MHPMKKILFRIFGSRTLSNFCHGMVAVIRKVLLVSVFPILPSYCISSL